MFEEKIVVKKLMRESYLIQRLHKPSTFNIAGKIIDNPFSFGGGYKNGGLSGKAMDFIRDIFSFDYMGSAEFEFGAVPAALNFLADQAGKSNLIASNISLGNNEIVYYLCPCPYKEEIEKRIKILRTNKIHLKEYCGLNHYFDEDSEYAKRNVGWLELDNGFMFFVDKEMFEKTCSLFGIDN